MIEFYKQETQDSGFKLKISGSLDECADFLSVDKALLQSWAPPLSSCPATMTMTVLNQPIEMMVSQVMRLAW